MGGFGADKIGPPGVPLPLEREVSHAVDKKGRLRRGVTGTTSSAVVPRAYLQLAGFFPELDEDEIIMCTSPRQHVDINHRCRWAFSVEEVRINEDTADSNAAWIVFEGSASASPKAFKVLPTEVDARAFADRQFQEALIEVRALLKQRQVASKFLEVPGTSISGPPYAFTAVPSRHCFAKTEIAGMYVSGISDYCHDDQCDLESDEEVEYAKASCQWFQWIERCEADVEQHYPVNRALAHSASKRVANTLVKNQWLMLSSDSTDKPRVPVSRFLAFIHRKQMQRLVS